MPRALRTRVHAILVAAIAASVAGCSLVGGGDPTPRVVYVTPPPTPVVIYVTPVPATATPVTPAANAPATPAPTPKPAREPRPERTRKPRPTRPPVSEDQRAFERLIKAHIPDSFRSVCKPNRTGLPPNALAGMDCPIGRGQPVKLVGYYIFETLGAMDAAYYNRLSEYGVAFSVPYGTLGVFVLVAVVCGLIAAILPARRASRQRA